MPTSYNSRTRIDTSVAYDSTFAYDGVSAYDATYIGTKYNTRTTETSTYINRTRIDATA